MPVGLKRPNEGFGQYCNVTKGRIVYQEQEYGSITGCIEGLRTVEKEYEGNKRIELQIKVRSEDKETGEVMQYIITSTMFYGSQFNTTSTWAWMFLLRLVNPENKIDKFTELEIGAYSGSGDSKASCASLRLAGDSRALQGGKIAPEIKEDPRRFRIVVEKAFERAVEMFGTFGQSNGDEYPAHEDPPPVTDEDLPF